LQNLAFGFAHAHWQNSCSAVGCVVGTLAGLLPGLGVGQIAAPAFDVLSPLARAVRLAGVYYGAQYGDSVS
jgi:TctA family transporter